MNDVDYRIALDQAKGLLGIIIFLSLLVLIVWIVYDDTRLRDVCEENETYIHSQTEYTICEKSDGSLIRR